MYIMITMEDVYEGFLTYARAEFIVQDNSITENVGKQSEYRSRRRSFC